MAKRKTPDTSLARADEPLYGEIRAVLEAARTGAYRAVNAAMVQAYWNIGRLIVEHEQGGAKRAAYGEAVLEALSYRLTADFGRGFTTTNLKYMRSFYLAFPIRHALRDESAAPDANTTAVPTFAAVLRAELSWTHYRLLLGVESPEARDWYLREAADQHWSTRQLERQISVLYYERLLSSREKAPVRKEAAGKLAGVEPEQFIRDPYVLEFLDLKDYPALRESAVEQAIIDNLQAFLLELGNGFSFVARQRRMRFEDEDFYVDLVFYHYLLRCFVLVDLKVGKLTHQDIGQMDSYVRMFDAHARPEGDNPTIGLILCSSKNEAIAKYSVLSEARQIFAAKYVKVLPTEQELASEVERERRLVDARRADEGKR
jgi:predicted nuclease of restriction endonuclease-like (RecB) superfamily